MVRDLDTVYLGRIIQAVIQKREGAQLGFWTRGLDGVGVALDVESFALLRGWKNEDVFAGDTLVSFGWGVDSAANQAGNKPNLKGARTTLH